MKTVLKSQVPFLLDGKGAVTKRAVFSDNPGFVRVEHLPVKNKAFSGYTLDCASPCPELCRRTATDAEEVLELVPVPLGLPTACVTEKTFTSGSVRCSARLLRRAGCFSVSLDSPDFCESFVCSPLATEVRLEIYEVGAPLVGILEDGVRLTLFSCDGDFRKLFTARCTELRTADGRLCLRRHYADSRKRFEDVAISCPGGRLRTERLSCGFGARKKVYPELYPLYFLECLYEGFEEEMKEYLAPGLAEADPEVMRDYFGACDRVRLFSDRVAIEQNGALRYYFFDFEDGKIANFRN